MKRYLPVALCLFALCLSACHQKDELHTAANPSGNKLQHQKVDTSGLTLQTVDINHDGTPDQRIYLKGDVVRYAERDFNFDGTLDMVEYYDENGIHTRDEIDLDYDGIIDLVVVYENDKVVRKEYSVDFEGNRHGVQYFDDSGARYEIRRDTDRDGKLDTIESYKNNESEPYQVKKIDSDGNDIP